MSFNVLYITIFYTDNFHKVLSSTLVHKQVNFNFESTFVKQYFGTDHSHELSYEEFVQLLQVHDTCEMLITLTLALLHGVQSRNPTKPPYLVGGSGAWVAIALDDFKLIANGDSFLFPNTLPLLY